MRFHKITDWNIWYGGTGKSDYARQMGNFIAFRLMVELFIVIPFKLLIEIPYQIFSHSQEQKRSTLRKEFEEWHKINDIISSIEKLIPEAELGQSKTARKNNARKILQLLDSLEELGKKDTITNFDELRDRTKCLLKIADAIDFLDKADKRLFLNQKKREKNYLLEALYHLITYGVTNKEFNSLSLKSEFTGRIWTVRYLKQRIINAGHQPI